MSNLRNLTFEHLLTYIAVIETGSLTRAAERLGIGKTAVSKNIQRLEHELGASLIVRTTRRINVTEAGASFFEACSEIAQLAGEAMFAVSPAPDQLRGTLRVASSVEYSALVLAPVLARMRTMHPGLRIEMVSGDRPIDMIAEGVDVALRLGELADSSHRAVGIGKYSKWLVASHDFVAHHALAADIHAAGDAPFIGLSVLPHPSRCNLRHVNGESLQIDFVAEFIADTFYACRAAAAEGAGIALLPDFSVQADIAAGRLVRVYPEWSSAPLPIHALLPPGKHIAPKTRALIDMLKAGV
ncbi:LysR family transcriptional regulator [Trinickia sp. LjRoot230]|uniref:LysR family transcriptional regulator n=1 Tax=Trinickia sp. LjRoot230 TaxID=3342288 RepID=UPI003ED16EC0